VLRGKSTIVYKQTSPRLTAPPPPAGPSPHLPRAAGIDTGALLPTGNQFPNSIRRLFCPALNRSREISPSPNSDTETGSPAIRKRRMSGVCGGDSHAPAARNPTAPPKTVRSGVPSCLGVRDNTRRYMDRFTLVAAITCGAGVVLAGLSGTLTFLSTGTRDFVTGLGSD
jgi:hypothetical protein